MATAGLGMSDGIGIFGPLNERRIRRGSRCRGNELSETFDFPEMW